MLKYMIIVFFSLFSFFGISQSITGIWKSYDDASGELKSEVEIYSKDGKFYGKIIQLHNLKIDLKDAKCYDCMDYRKNQPVLGMEIITGLIQSGRYWSANKALLDPNNGKMHDAKLWLVDVDKLAVRGYIGWFYRTQYWVRKQ